jgi:hypothetical protein
MKTFKIYGEPYELFDTASEVVDAYAVKGEVVDEIPKGKFVGYVTMEDGSLIGCYKRFNPLVIIIPILLVAVIGGAVLFYLINMQDKDVSIGGFTIKQGTDNNVISYNGFMAIRDGTLSVDFTNGDYPCTIQVVADGISCDPISVAANEYVATVPATFTTDAGLVQAKIIITTGTSTDEEDVVIEIPDNNTPDSPDSGLEGYWKGEYVYGTDLSTAK